MLFLRKIVLFGLALFLVACSGPKTMYYWDEYEAVIYQYHNNDVVSFDQQAIDMEKIIEKARSKNMPLPPSFHAHLGLLYVNLGYTDKALAEFETEKELFGESTVFMDFLINQTKGNAR